MKSEWVSMKFSDFAEFNPRESIPKGALAKKVPMDVLQPFCRDITTYETTAFSGGTKFRNGDTIMARITPCLENGKIAKVNILDNVEVGFGSTEYIVFRAKEEISDPDFIYYLVSSPIVREPAIKSMVGSSGRQRVQTDVVKNLEIALPPLDEQKKIAGILKAMDDKIQLNDAINNNLEQQAQALYQKMTDSMDMRVPNGMLSDICDYSKDRIAVSELGTNNYYSTENMLPNKSGAIEATGLPTTAQTTKCHKGDTLISNIRPYFKKILFCEDDCGCSTDVLCFTPNASKYAGYLFNALYSDKFFDFVMAGAKGTKMPRGDKKQIMTYPIVIPSEESLCSFNAIVMPILQMIKNNRTENKWLTELRDSLLPKLMSGELDVSDIDL